MFQTTYTVLYFARIVLVFLPQTGYIHLDEHFQGPEVVYGDIWQIKVSPPWEFTQNQPIRNIVFPYFITGIPAFIVNFVGFQDFYRSHWYSYLVLIMPRIIMCCLSFLNDFLLYKLCLLLKMDHKVYLSLFASSYVTLVYLPRTFSNSIEVLLFSALLFIVYQLLYLKKGLPKGNSLNFVHTSFLLGVLIALGVFNRPTFVCFAVFPVTVFLFLISQMKWNIINHLVSFILGGFCTSLVFIAVDTLYFRQIHYSNIFMRFSPSTFLFPIINKSESFSSLLTSTYMDEDNMFQKLLHVIEVVLIVVLLLFFMIDLLNLKKSLPERSFFNFPYTSFLCGALITQGVLNTPICICLVVLPMNLIFQARNKINHIAALFLGGFSLFLAHTAITIFFNDKMHYSMLIVQTCNLTKLLTFSTINTPLNFILYNTDHNNLEAHGLHPWWLHMCVNIPLLFSVYGIMLMVDFICNMTKLTFYSFKGFLMLSFVVPLCLLSIVPHQEPRFLIPLIFPMVLLHNTQIRCSYLGRKLWYISNILAVLFYGFLHQSGVYLSSSYLHSQLIRLEITNQTSAVLFYKTYTPPQYLLGLQKTLGAEVYNLDDISFSTFKSRYALNTLIDKPFSVYLITSYEMINPIADWKFHKEHKTFQHKEFFPHISTENLPSLSKVIDEIRNSCSFLDKLKKIRSMLSIQVLTFTPDFDA